LDYSDWNTVSSGFHTLYTISLKSDDGHIMMLVGMVFLILSDSVDDLIHALDGLFVDGRHAPAFVQDDNVVDVHSAVCFGLLVQIYIVFALALQRLQGLQNSYLTIPGIIRIFATP
jgi:hypothetical protein